MHTHQAALSHTSGHPSPTEHSSVFRPTAFALISPHPCHRQGQ